MGCTSDLDYWPLSAADPLPCPPMSRSPSRSSGHYEPFNFPENAFNNTATISDPQNGVNDQVISSSFAQSLLSARKPSWTPSLSFRDMPSEGIAALDTHGAPDPKSQLSSPEDGGNFRRSLQIDNKGLVGDAVGNVSKHAWYPASVISSKLYRPLLYMWINSHVVLAIYSCSPCQHPGHGLHLHSESPCLSYTRNHIH